MLNPIERFKRSVLRLNRSLHHWYIKPYHIHIVSLLAYFFLKCVLNGVMINSNHYVKIIFLSDPFLTLKGHYWIGLGISPSLQFMPLFSSPFLHRISHGIALARECNFSFFPCKWDPTRGLGSLENEGQNNKGAQLPREQRDTKECVAVCIGNCPSIDYILLRASEVGSPTNSLKWPD